jgi:hypothetical protein
MIKNLSYSDAINEAFNYILKIFQNLLLLAKDCGVTGMLVQQ